ncbi:hypothetical protein K1T71_007166 [Dendrolimus kikuchii]|uniref:Uncharacterized protein n=1 Tax=Dendrolimus kikuchii TaxID=765133 RepID=A0ACC1D1A0_9NEOP|nr:hypothetical protein K1T71_007166 [Dendrolimus kikuchii]
MITVITSMLITTTLVLIFRLLNAKWKPPIFGVYQQRNKFYYFKFILMYIILKLRQLKTWLKRTYPVLIGKSDDGTIHVHKDDDVYEQKFYLGDHLMSVDAVYFNGMSQNGDAVICGLARRPKKTCDTFVYLKVAGYDLLLSPMLPDTYIQQTMLEEGEYKVQGLEIVKFIPMRTWKIMYKGDMKPKSNSDKKITVEMNLTWSAHWSPFNFDWQISPSCMAADLAREQWSRDYFKLLTKYHQSHYEQMGYLKGTVLIDGKEHTLNMPCIRDHSFGHVRDWKTFHRYVLHFMFLENGDCLAVGSVSQPVLLSHLTIGYVCRASDQKVVPITYSDFKLYHHGENQILPRDYGFVFVADGNTYSVKVQVNDEDTFFMGKEKEVKLYERWSTVEVNGIKGWGCLEWLYNNVTK